MARIGSTDESGSTHNRSMSVSDKGCTTTPFFVFAVIGAVATLFLALTAYTHAFGTIRNTQPFQYATWGAAGATGLAAFIGFAVKCCQNRS